MSYNLYKPLRNNLRQLAFLECLSTLRAYIQYFSFSTPLPTGIRVAPQFYSRIPIVYGWQLELLTKEVILNCPDQGGEDFRSWNTLADALNKLRDLENGTAKAYPKDYNVLLEMFRIAHRQFPWQQPQRATRALSRYFKIFSTPDLSALIAQKTGLDAYQLYSIGLALTGFFMDGFALPAASI